jgi:hypothetical protein
VFSDLKVDSIAGLQYIGTEIFTFLNSTPIDSIDLECLLKTQGVLAEAFWGRGIDWP